MMEELLTQCDSNLKRLPCCHTDGRKCKCYDCLKEGFWGMPDTYNCEKKLNYYVINYGPSFASEIFHYLTNSQILNGFNGNKNLKILSLGCGFAPDLIAIEKYILDNGLNIHFEYNGVDLSNLWKSARYNLSNAHFVNDDVSQRINLNEFDIIFIVKLFSTLWENKLDTAFIQTLSNAITTQMKSDAILIFNDINTNGKGRDTFHRKIKALLSHYRQFYCGDPPYKDCWIQIPEKNIIFSIPIGLSINPLMEIRNTIFFEYRK